MANKPIFFDSTGRRAARLSLIGWSAAVLSLVLGVGFMVSLLAFEHAAATILPGRLTAIHTADLERKAVDPGLVRLAARLASEVRLKREEFARAHWARRTAPTKPLSAILKPQHGRSLSIGFYPSWQASAYDSLEHALAHLDWVAPTWLQLSGTDMTLKNSYSPNVYSLVQRNKPGTAIVPLVQNATLGKWDGPGLALLLKDPKRRSDLESGISAFVIGHKLQGIVVDFEQVPPDAYGNLKLFLKQLSAQFAKSGLIVAIAAPFDDETYPYASLAQAADYTILMAYDEHDDSSGAGSIAGQSWYENTLDQRMKVLNPQRTIIAIGSYGYDWNNGGADSLSFQEATIAAHDSEATIDYDDATNNPHFSYIEEDHTLHDVWLLDGVTAYNEIHAADSYQPAGYALWRLGSEDPSVWDVIGRPYGALPPTSLRDIPIGRDIDFEGQGEILRVESQPTPGVRSFELDPATGDINDEDYLRLPSSYVIRQWGYSPDKIALTFDDGPDPQWTPQILDILKANHIKATFFIIGANAEANPGLVQRMIAEGHEVGNHTYTHPNLADTPAEAVRLELNATQRLFEALTGRSLKMFRPPYLGDAEPTDEDELIPVEIAQDMGYTTVGEHVDPIDWSLPGVKYIVDHSLAAVHDPRPETHGSILLLHDAGGDRSQTVAALPILIAKLRAGGYKFVPVSALAGLTTAQAMPELKPSLSRFADRVVFFALNLLGRALYWMFLTAIWLGISRMFFLAILSVWNRPREDEIASVPVIDEPILATVIIPAYNEAKVIAGTISGILQSDHKALNVLVIDDGSSDNTSDVVRTTFGNDPRVELIRVPNGGKATALNVGLARAQGEVVVALDADTQFNRDTIPRLLRWFTDPNLGAVAGNAKVGNRINMVTRWQALEYIVAQNMERRALAALGTLTVVPGAVGAWRRSAITKAGGFKSDTVAEDQDLTIALQKAGYRVQFDSSAIAWTEAPTDFRGLARQRFRWAYGTLQCLWKYRDVTFNRKYGALGTVALPQVWLFQIILTALAPLADLLLVWQLFWQWIAYLQHGAEFNNTDLVTVGIYYLVFVFVDLLSATFGFLMEKKESWSLLPWLVLQRFGYRQLMYYVVVRSISTAARGAFVGWGKLERTGTVKVRQA